MRPSCFTTFSTLALTLVLAGCEKGVSREPFPDGPQAQPKAASAGTADPAGEPASTGEALGGAVLETMDSGGYTYLKLQTPQGEVWTAVPQASVRTGDRVMVVNAMLMTGFESPTLHRRFDAIYFGSLAASASAPDAAGSDAAASVAEAHAGSVRAAKEELAGPVPKAEGADARTIEEVYAQRSRLAGQSVAVRGKVTRVRGDILGKTWLHLQDGSGSAEAGDFDLTVTTDATPAAGQIVTARGVLALDRDLGHGYVYAVLLENATLEGLEPAPVP
jgi:hypothetical protein